MKEEHSYPFLLFFSRIYKVLGYISAVFAVIVPLIFMFVGSPIKDDFGVNVISYLLLIIGSFLILGLVSLTLLSFAEAIVVFIDIEDNTNETKNNISELVAILKEKQI